VADPTRDLGSVPEESIRKEVRLSKDTDFTRYNFLGNNNPDTSRIEAVCLDISYY
jgi:hypothetical protein